MLGSRPGPAYIRLGKAGEPVLHKRDINLQYGKSIVVSEGNDLTLVSTGAMLGSTISAAQKLGEAGYSVRVLSMPFAIPLDREAILSAVDETGAVITVEEHGYGGLGTTVGECIALSGKGTTFRSIRLGRSPIKVAGSQEQLRALQGLSVDEIVRVAEDSCRQRAPRTLGRASADAF
jgi:transketolase